MTDRDTSSAIEGTGLCPTCGTPCVMHKLSNGRSYTPSSVAPTAEKELLDKEIMALSGQYVNDEDGDTNKECWNSAVGYCIGALRTMQEQIAAVRPTTEGSKSDACPICYGMPMLRFDGNTADFACTHCGSVYGTDAILSINAELQRRANPSTVAATTWPNPDDWNLVCPKCGASTEGPCGWPTNCPTGLAKRSAIAPTGEKT